MKKFVLVFLLCLPSYSFAQENVADSSPSPSDTPTSPTQEQTGSTAVALPVVAPVRTTYTPRPMRKIENREFSNRDKIMLLLSAHCDFPSKEDLISTISFDKMYEDEAEMAENASMTRKNKSEASANPKTSNGESSQSQAPEEKKASSAPLIEAADWRKLSPEEKLRVETYLQNILYTILKDESVLFTVRRRSLEALAYFNTEKNVRMLTYILTHPESIKRPLMLVQAIRSFPEVAPDKAAEILAPYLTHENDMVRFVTISTLQKTPDPEAVRVMQQRLEVETNRFFKARLQEAITCHDQKLTTCR